MTIALPELALVVLIGPSGSGKSTFARRHFKPTEVLGSDYCRGLVADDESDQAATNAAFDVLHYIAAKRLAGGRLPEHIGRVRALNRKRALALREFALGIEALERFVRGEPLRRVHECVFGVLALETEPVDPRL